MGLAFFLLRCAHGGRTGEECGITVDGDENDAQAQIIDDDENDESPTDDQDL